MHQFLKTIGFSEIKTKKEVRALKEMVIREASRKEMYPINNEENIYCYEKDFGECFGICVISIGPEEKDSEIDNFFPYVKGCNFLFNEKFDVDKCFDREGYYGVCEDNNIGIPMIFSLNNPLEYRRLIDFHEDPNTLNCVTLAGLATDGVVLLPIKRDENQRRNERKKNQQRNEMINAAKAGDIEAMEQLTLEDMDTFTKVNIRSKKEDIFTIVSSYFMPYTVECDKYAIMADITGVATMKNKVTGEELYYLSLNCNTIEFEVMINKKDMMGIPEKGRRWKGHVWMQGQMDYL